MFNLDKFIADSVTFRPVSMFAADIEANKKAFEQMSFFSAVVIFLVGLITIFTGNDAKVSLVDKFQYVIILGVLLLLFVCLGHFVITPRYEKSKPWVFGSLTVAFLFALLWYIIRNF